MKERASDIGKAGGFCAHGNEPATCEACNAEREALQALLLTPEQEDAEARHRGPPPYVQRERDGEREIVVYGTAHVFAEEDARPIADAFADAAPQLVLLEGEQWQRVDGSLPDDEVLTRFGEQAYIARLAQKQGIEVRSWDLLQEETIRSVREHGKDAVLGWMIGQSAKHLIAQERPCTPEGVREMIATFLGEGSARQLQKEGLSFDVSDKHLDALAERYAGKKVSEMDMGTAEAMASPRRRGPTNDVIRSMNEARDRHALDLMHDAKFGFKKVFVLAGGSHALTWEKAVKKLYGSAS